MGFWFWFTIFLTIAVVALVSFAAIGLSLAKRAQKLKAPGERLQALAAKLEASQVAEVTIPKLVAALDQNASTVQSRHRAVLKANKQRKEARQRRLVERLRSMEIDESRFR